MFDMCGRDSSNQCDLCDIGPKFRMVTFHCYHSPVQLIHVCSKDNPGKLEEEV